jgi:hypothetical protein
MNPHDLSSVNSNHSSTIREGGVMSDGDGWLLLAAVAAITFAGASAVPTGNSTLEDTFQTTRSNSTTPSRSNIPTGPLASCPGFIVGQRTDAGMTLRVYYSPESGGLNCVSGTRNSAVDSNSYVRTEIRLTRYSGSSWPSYAYATGAYGQETVTGAYVTDANDLCVSANVAYFPGGGAEPQSISMRQFACR